MYFVYVFESFGSAVHIGRDKKKCAIALPVDAQGVSRVHGSLAWSGQGELTFSDTSTYGTLVDGTLVKATNKAVNDKSHILVGDVELIISFVPQTSTNTSSSNSSTAFLKYAFPNQGSSAKRKSVLTDSLSNEKKRSKLEPPQSRKISSFFQKGSNTTEYDTLMVLAEDTPRSQSSTSRKGATQNLISFVSDSVEDPPDGKSTLSDVKT
ncbi:FHA domain protein, partial [Necator americanus]